MSLFLQYAWTIPLFPLLSFAAISLTPLGRNRFASGWLAVGLMALATLFALGALAAVASHMGGPQAMLAALGMAAETGFRFPPPAASGHMNWVATGTGFFTMGFYVDPIVAVMLAMVTLASTCIHLFSLGYMAGNPQKTRFYGLISLFTAAMLATTLADNLLLFFMAWEVMGLCSYMLIGFVSIRPQATRAALKAFITTRIGDVLLMVGLAYLYTQAGGLAYGENVGQIFNPELLARLGSETNALGLTHATAIALLLFCGTVGKSAQFPLHVWLPDAMEGPTPVSALIHAATMVAAGVFLVGRTYPIFLADGGMALMVVAFVGTFTAIFAAVIAVAQFDIKRILAYSTMSQLGFMVAALGIGGWTAAMFHLLAHAFFKALLFLGSGAIIHGMESAPAISAVHEHDGYASQQTAQDVRNMGGLRAELPWTFWTYTCGFLALAGIIPFAGFWSKDEILADAFTHGHWVVFSVLTIAAFLTAFYMTRQWLLVFFGSFRGDTPVVFHNPEPATDQGDHDTDHDTGEHPWHEDWRMTAPLVVLASFAVLAGLFNLPVADVPGGHWLSALLGQEPASLNLVVAAVSLLAAGSGIGLGYWMYSSAFQHAQDTDPLELFAPRLFRALQHRLYVDEFYQITVGTAVAVTSALLGRADRALAAVVQGVGSLALFLGRMSFIVDDTLLNDGPDGLAEGTNRVGDRARRITTGVIQDYGSLLFGGAIVLTMVFVYWLRG